MIRTAVEVSVFLLCLLTAFVGVSPAVAGKNDVPEKIKETVAMTFADEVMRGGYKTVSTEELKKWVDADKDMLVIDTMPYEASYKKQHIPGAVQMVFPIPEMKDMDEATKKKFMELLGEDKDKPLVFYCGFVECTRSHNGAMWAVNLGYRNVYRNPGGIEGWVQAGYPAQAEK